LIYSLFADSSIHLSIMQVRRSLLLAFLLWCSFVSLQAQAVWSSLLLPPSLDSPSSTFAFEFSL
jgi:hypothetical protein